MSYVWPIRIPTILKHVVGEFTDGVEVAVGIGWVGGFGGGADR